MTTGYFHSNHLQELFGNLPNLRRESRGTNQWSAACPKCGGQDRFVIWDDDRPRYWCRVCEFKGFLDTLSAAEVKEAVAIRMAQDEVRQREEQQRIENIRREAYWQGYHDAMAQTNRDLWRQRGLPDAAQDYWALGYTPQCPHVPFPAMTIPYRDRDFEVNTIQYRIVSDDTSAPRYADTPGIKSRPFWMLHEIVPSDQPLLITEGAIKGMVATWQLVVKDGMDIAVVSLANATPPPIMVTELAEYDWPRVYIATDPDTFFEGNRAQRIGDKFGDRARYVRLPGKIDDLINLGWNARDISVYLNQATKDIA